MKLVNISMFFKVFVGISGCFSVLFGAWLAHAGPLLLVKEQTSLSSALEYQFIHTLALLVVVVWNNIQPHRFLFFSASLFVLGILAFSGGIYLKTLFGFQAAGQFAPLGGISMALGWLCLLFVGEKKS